MFDINFYSKRSEFHRYSTVDFALLSIGLGNYTRSSAYEFLIKTTPPNPDVVEFFGNAQRTYDKIVGVGSEATMEILDFDVVDKTYKIQTGLQQIATLNPQKFPATQYPPVPVGNIVIFLEAWNKVQDGLIVGPIANTYKAIVDKIHNSASGCLFFKTDINVLGLSRKVDIMLIPTYIRDNKSNRTMSFKGAPLISAVPQTAEGLQYGFKETNSVGIGSYVAPYEGGADNPKNTATGNLRLTYDPTTGEFESGTQQVLVRLVDDVDAVEMTNIDGKTLLESTVDECYSDIESDVYMGGFTKGRGIPLSMENGNPYMYGPNFKGGCNSSTDKSVIIVVNRSPQSFKGGRVVMCSRINGEWVIIPTGGEAAGNRKISFGNFEYQQYIIPADRYFTLPTSSKRVLPTAIAETLRKCYYTALAEQNDPRYADPEMNDLSKIVLLNMFASLIPQDVEDPIGYLNEEYDEDTARSILQSINEEDINSVNQFIIDTAEYLITPGGEDENTYNEITNMLPKNVGLKNARKFSISGFANPDTVDDRRSEEPAYGDEVAFFWGMIFPDGYKTDGTARFIGANLEEINRNPLLRDDKNFKEMSITANIALPDLKDQFKNLLILDQIKNSSQFEFGSEYTVNPLNYSKKTAGIFVYKDLFTALGNDIMYSTYNMVSLNSLADYRFNALQRFNSIGEDGAITTGQNVFGLEPVKPGKIQFSSMSIEHLYSKSLLLSDNYVTLYASREYYDPLFFRDGTPPALNVWFSQTFNDYLYDWWGPNRVDEEFLAESSVDDGNAYNLPYLVTSRFTAAMVQRHPSPLGTANFIVPSIPDKNGVTPRSVVMPVLTCKSKIKTSAEALSFEVTQFLGMPKRQVVSPGDVGDLTILPIGLIGLAWQTPDTPVSVQGFPQWGDRTNTDGVDNFGTSSLHVRIFDGWPIEQTIYLGNCFTPLHFNPSIPDNAKVITYENGIPRVVDAIDDQGGIIPGRSSVDFRVPTSKEGSALPVGSVTPASLAPYAEWKWNTIRRAKLLTGGGFAYIKRYIGISKDSVSIKEAGDGYTAGDKFIYPDGTEIEVLADGPISSISITEGKNELTSIIENVQPAYNGSTGSGAVWQKVKFLVKEKYEYDLAPKEHGESVRLTKPSKNGDNVAEGTITSVIELLPNNRKEYDIFYFFQNDPTHYSIDRTLAFNSGFAQYATVSVTPAQ